LQDRFDTRRLADRIADRQAAKDGIDDDDRAFIEARDMFFLATADEEGRPQCSYKGGDVGFVRVLDERTIAFPNYDGNGMFLSLGNALVNSHVGLLFVDFEGRKRLRLNGMASIDGDDPLLAEYPEAQFVVRVRATEVSRTARATSTSTGSWSARASCRVRAARRRCPSGSGASGRATSYPEATRRELGARRRGRDGRGRHGGRHSGGCSGGGSLHGVANLLAARQLLDPGLRLLALGTVEAAAEDVARVEQGQQSRAARVERAAFEHRLAHRRPILLLERRARDGVPRDRDEAEDLVALAAHETLLCQPLQVVLLRSAAQLADPVVERAGAFGRGDRLERSVQELVAERARVHQSDLLPADVDPPG
jgi:predicted pyridoxine 5'-phosphate oxidase superfamily flavin-nucleotide-binding protein